MPTKTIALVSLALLTLATGVDAQTLKGSRASMQRQHQAAITYGYTFLRTPTAVKDFVSQGHLIKITPSADFLLHDVSYPYARPEVKTFVERLSGQYRTTCGEPLTVTSLTRPIDRQPSNAATDSVHPTGMAVDLRIPGDAKCRSWLEKTLLSLESTGVLDVTRERNPAHYHVAVFTKTYGNYIASLSEAVPPAAVTEVAVLQPAVATTTVAELAPPAPAEYVVRKGDTLSVIADRTGSTIAKLRAANGIRGNLIHVGQKLVIPAKTKPVVAANDTAAPQNAAAQTGATKSTIKAKTASKKKSSGNQQVASNESATHKVRRGDTLWRIANRYGISTNSLMRVNGLNDDTLQPGQVLRIR